MNTINEQTLLKAIKVILNSPQELISNLSDADKQQVLDKFIICDFTCDICGTKISERDNNQNFGLCKKCLKDNNSK